MGEFIASDDTWTYRGPMEPTTDAGSVFVPRDTPLRFERSAQHRGVWARRVRSRDLSWSLRIWLRYAVFVAPPLPLRETGVIRGSEDTDRHWFNIGLGPARGTPPD